MLTTRKILASLVATVLIFSTGCSSIDEISVMSVSEYAEAVSSTEVFTTTEVETTTSTAITSDVVTEATTEPPTLDETKQITISFLGDCTLASQKGQEQEGNMINYLNIKDTSYFFEKCMEVIGNDDFTVANCENVFSDIAINEVPKDHNPAFWFRSSTKNTAVFANNSIDAVSISNNHTNDYGASGYAETKTALENANVLWGDAENPIILEKDDIRIGIICCKFWSSYYEDSIIKQIKELSEKTSIQIVFFHGGTEKVHTPESWKVEGSKKFVDAGADLVIGGHPHVLQPYEEYNGVSIIYSIGNFCYGGNRQPENRTIIYQQTFTLDSSNTIISSEENIIPFYVYTGPTNNWQPAPIEDETEKNKVLNFLYGMSDSLF